jgi:hypothetical protein
MILMIKLSGHLKLTGTFFDFGQFNKENMAEGSSRKRRSSTPGGGPGSKRERISYKNTGKKRVLILGSIPEAQENYHNCKMLFDLTGVNKIPYTLAYDLKALNKALGLGPHSSAYPCGYCRCRSHRTTGWLHAAPVTCTCFRRTLGSLKEQVTLWRQREGEVKDPTGLTAFSVTNNALIDQPGDSQNIQILDLCPPCSLHLKLGVNEALGHLDKEMEGDTLTTFLLTLNIKYEPYFGGKTLEGKEVSKLLKNLNLLENIVPDKCKPFIDFMRAYAGVVNSCFHVDLLDSWQEDIICFGVKLANLLNMFPRVKMTPKWHIILNHVPEWIERNNKGLGQVSEQEVEDTHSQFEKVWSKYRVKNVDNPTYLPNYFKSITDHNTTNLGFNPELN